MKEMKEHIKRLLDVESLSSITSEDIIGQICLNLYNKENFIIRSKEIFSQLPTIIKDIILIIDFDTELNMNGILGFLENSTGLFLDDTIDTLKRINAVDDYEILTRIRGALQKYGTSTQQLRDNVNSGREYEITSFSETHGKVSDEMANEIVNIAEGLYLYQEERNIFEKLTEYVESNRNVINTLLK